MYTLRSGGSILTKFTKHVLSVLFEKELKVVKEIHQLITSFFNETSGLKVSIKSTQISSQRLLHITSCDKSIPQ